MESIGLEVYVGQLGRNPLCIYAATKRIKVAAKKDINRRRNLDSSRSLYILGFATGNSSTPENRYRLLRLFMGIVPYLTSDVVDGELIRLIIGVCMRLACPSFRSRRLAHGNLVSG